LESVAVIAIKHYPQKTQKMIERFTLIHLTLEHKSNNEQISLRCL